MSSEFRRWIIITVLLLFILYLSDMAQAQYGVLDHNKLFYGKMFGFAVAIISLLVLHYRRGFSFYRKNREGTGNNRHLMNFLPDTLVFWLFCVDPLLHLLNAHFVHRDEPPTVVECKLRDKKQERSLLFTHHVYRFDFELCSGGLFVPGQNVKLETYNQFQPGTVVKLSIKNGGWMRLIESYSL